MKLVSAVYIWFFLAIKHINSPFKRFSRFLNPHSGAGVFTMIVIFFPIVILLDWVLPITFIKMPLYVLVILLLIIISGVLSKYFKKIEDTDITFQKIKELRDGKFNKSLWVLDLVMLVLMAFWIYFCFIIWITLV